MADWAPEIAAITLFEDDLEAARGFYERVFGAPPQFEDASSVVFKFGRTLINLLRTPAAHDLIAPAPVAGREAGAQGALTIFVEDVDAVCAHLEGAGVALLNGPINRPWGMRTAAFEDPSGHIWELGQELPSKFMLFIRVKDGFHLGPEERTAMQQGVEAWVADLDARGVRLMGSELLGGTGAREVRVRAGEAEVGEASASQDPEPIAGFDIIECANLDEAVAIALRHPVAAFGTIEVRPFGS